MNGGEKINLALSGGGIRAMAFHTGVLRRLAEDGGLERVNRISSVSGGSLLVGLILTESGMHWPDSREYLTRVLPALREKLCGRSMVWDMVRGLIKPGNLRFLFNRSNLLAYTLHRDWGVKARLQDLPATPDFAFEGTTAENGKRFFFSRNKMGDYDIGYTDCGKLPLAVALAVSAAFPGGIGPLKLYTAHFEWFKKAYSAGGGKKTVTPDFSALHLYDGGVYDNLGLEPFFNIGSQSPKGKKSYLLVSDAGSPFTKGFSWFALNPLRLKRVLDVMQEQCRALRVRSLCGYLAANPGNGVYIRINAETGNPGDEELRIFASSFPTTLRRLKEKEFDDLSRYGFLVADKCLAESGTCAMPLPEEVLAAQEILSPEEAPAAGEDEADKADKG